MITGILLYLFSSGRGKGLGRRSPSAARIRRGAYTGPLKARARMRQGPATAMLFLGLACGLASTTGLVVASGKLHTGNHAIGALARR